MANFKSKLQGSVSKNNSLLCVGLDPDISKIPKNISQLSDPLFAFNQAVIDATANLVCAFKPNSAFYESAGEAGISQLHKTCRYILDKYPHIPLILDAKRADIGSTNDHYARYAFDYLQVDAITIHPYLGQVAIEPFLTRQDKGIIVLCRTTNEGAGEFQDLKSGGERLYQIIARRVKEKWNINDNCLLVVGATYPDELAEIRRIVGDEMTFLVPGIGAQGGDIESVVKAGLNSQGDGLIISSTRDIIFASSGGDFAEAARQKAIETRDQINKYRGKR
jgi:orotidine-5'-phosphate decarboxylase